MAGASIEATLALWASSLREVKSVMRPLFAQERAAVSAGLFLDGLLGDERRKTGGWMRAEAAGDPGPWRQQALLGRDRWDADASSRARRRAVWRGSTRVRPVRSRTARSACLSPMYRATAMPVSIEHSICQKVGPMIRLV